MEGKINNHKNNNGEKQNEKKWQLEPKSVNVNLFGCPE
jgi:hypothetical protein